MRKKIYWKKAAAIGLSAVLCCSMSGCASDSGDAKNNDSKQEEAGSDDDLVNTMSNVTGIGSNNEDSADKEETVYVIADKNGKPSEVIVSEWLKNDGSGKALKDITNLTEIENVKGDEQYQSTSDGIEWENSGSDIYYQGKSKESLPVSVKVTYFLDNQQISPDSLLGKSGKIKIRYEYTNNSTTSIDINGTKEDIYTPFVMATGVVLPNDKFKNVTVENGDVISEGNNTIAFGVGMPGLADNLALDEMDNLDVDVDIPDYFEVTADVTDFSLGMSITLCSNTLLDLSNIDSGSLDDVNANIDDLTDAADKLIDGTQALNDGTVTLKDGTSSLKDGVNTLSDGVTTYTNGVSSLKDGAKQIADGTVTLDDGAKALSDNLLTAKTGSDKIVEGLKTASTGATYLQSKLGDAKNGSVQIKDGLETLNIAAPQLLDGIEAVRGGAGQLVAGYEGDGTEANPGAVAGAKAVSDGLAELDSKLKQFNLPDMSGQQATLTDEQKAAIQAEITNYLGSDEGKAIVSQYTESFKQNVNAQLANYGVTLDAQTQYVLDNVIAGVFEQAFASIYISAYESGMEKGMGAVLEQVTAQLNEYIPTISTMKGAVSQLAEGSAAVSDGVNQLYNGTKQLRDGVNTMYDSAKDLPGGVNELYDGSTELWDGLGQLQSGAGSLAAGTTELYDGSNTLNSGLGQLYDGSVTLKGGTATLREGAATLNTGASALNEASRQILKGFVDLKAGTSKLDDGANQLQSGSLELKDGMVQFNDEGISKIESLVKDDLNGITDRVEAITDANDEYTLFGGIADGKSGKEIFIIKIDGIEE